MRTILPLLSLSSLLLACPGGDVAIDYVTGAGHEMDTTPPGADAILDALVTGCVR